MQRSLSGKLFFAGLALAGLATPANAIEVVEVGDYPNFSDFGPGAVSVGTLDLGENTITGELAGQCVVDSCNDPGSTGDSQDSFTLTVDSGARISGFTVTTTHVIGPTGFSATASLRSPTVHRIIPTSFLVLDGTTENLVIRPISEGVYSVSVYGQASEQPGPFSFEWTVTIEVEPEGLLFADGFETADTSQWSSTVGN